VLAAESWVASGGILTGESAIEQISQVYGRQAVVVSIDPRRVYVDSAAAAPNHTVLVAPCPNAAGQGYCWYQATIKGGREGRDLDAVALARACEALGAGEIMLNCIDADGQGSGFELPLIRAVAEAIKIPVIASSGAGAAVHFSQVFQETNVQAALAAGIFHREEVAIADVKSELKRRGLPCRS
jgi:glutamine amidotransferase/cyclase